MAPCVLWIDEIEKGLAGQNDSTGVSRRLIGQFLFWLQESRHRVFVVATSNDVRSLPPELLRKGRFDEIWWVDVPTYDERASIMAAALRTNGRDAEKIGIDLNAVAAATDTFTGAELSALVPEAMFTAFADDAREVGTDDLLLAAKTVVPLAKTAAEKIDRLRKEWAGRARPATSPTKQTAYEASLPARRTAGLDL